MLIRVQTIGKMSLLKILSVGVGVGSLVIFLVLGVMSAFGVGRISLEGTFTIGDGGFLDTLLFWPLFALVWILITWLFCSLGLWIFGKIKPLSLKLTEAEAPDTNNGELDI